MQRLSHAAAAAATDILIVREREKEQTVLFIIRLLSLKWREEGERWKKWGLLEYRGKKKKKKKKKKEEEEEELGRDLPRRYMSSAVS